MGGNDAGWHEEEQVSEICNSDRYHSGQLTVFVDIPCCEGGGIYKKLEVFAPDAASMAS